MKATHIAHLHGISVKCVIVGEKDGKPVFARVKNGKLFGPDFMLVEGNWLQTI